MREPDEPLRSSDRAANEGDRAPEDQESGRRPPGFAAALQRRARQRRAQHEQRPTGEATSVAGDGQALPEPVRGKMEGAFGSDFGDVRVHQDGQAEQVGAQAYTQGSDLHFEPGRYAPGTASGDELIGHELTHVVQQRAGRVAAPQQHKGGINDDPGLEAEADDAGARAAAGQRVAVPGAEARPAAGSGQAIQRMPQLSDIAQQIDDASDSVPEPTKAKKERDYAPAGRLAKEVSDDHYRFWGFEVDSAATRAEFNDVLSDVAKLVNHDPEAKLQVIGHTSSSGSEARNVGLSMQRAVTIMEQLAARGVNASSVMPLGHGETDPIVDESLGPSAMARNRRVEVKIVAVKPKPAATPATTAPSVNPPSGPASEPFQVSCRDAELWANLAHAQAEMWGFMDAGSRTQGGGQPRYGFGEAYMQPSLAEWRAAYRGNGVPEAWGEYVYPTLTLPLDANLLSVINLLKEEESMYRRLAKGEGRGCDADGVRSQPPKPVKQPPRDPMPGDCDSKGRCY